MAPSVASAAVDLAGAAEPDLTSAISLPDEEGKVTLDLDALSVDPTLSNDEFSMGVMPSPMPTSESSKTVGQKLNEARLIQFESKLFRISENSQKVMKAGSLIRKTSAFKNLVSEMVSEVEKLYQYLQESVGNIDDKELYENKLEKLYKDLNQLTEHTMKNRMNEADLTLKLTGLPDDVVDALDDVGVDIEVPEEEEGVEPEGDEGGEGEEGGELDLDLGGEEEEGGEGEEEEEEEEEEKKEEGVAMESRRLSDNTVVEIDEGMLRREISKMKALREAADDVQTWGHGAGDVSDDMDFEDDDLGDPLELDVTSEGVDELAEMLADEGMEVEGDEGKVDENDVEEMYQAADDKSMGGPGDRPAEQLNKQSRQPGKTVESLTHKLNTEVALQTEAKKKAHTAKKKQIEAAKKAKMKKAAAMKKEAAAKQAAAKKDAQGAKKMKDSAKGDVKEALQYAHQAKLMSEAYEFYATRFNESVQRTARLKTMLAEASGQDQDALNGSSKRLAGDSDNLRKKLAETNLFNMKLLYTNKLLQNESLTKRQKADVIERLDEAKSEREVKLVYESLVKTLAAPQRASLSEAAQSRVLGSSSAPTRPASTVLNESYEADRWAKLAGIK